MADAPIDRFTPAVLRHPILSGMWDVIWEVDSPNFVQVNTHCGQLYRCFNAIALEGVGTTVNGHEIPYGFVGRLSRDKSIATGTWFDRHWGDGGYHGVYQVRVPATRSDFWAAEFSRNKTCDASDLARAEADGWRALVVWECETADLAALQTRLTAFLGPPRQAAE